MPSPSSPHPRPHKQSSAVYNSIRSRQRWNRRRMIRLIQSGSWRTRPATTTSRRPHSSLSGTVADRGHQRAVQQSDTASSPSHAHAAAMLMDTATMSRLITITCPHDQNSGPHCDIPRLRHRAAQQLADFLIRPDKLQTEPSLIQLRGRMGQLQSDILSLVGDAFVRSLLNDNNSYRVRQLRRPAVRGGKPEASRRQRLPRHG